MNEYEQKEGQQEGTQDGPPPQIFANIVIYCHRKNVKNLVEAFEVQIEDASFPASVLWSGESGLLHMGVVVLEWEGSIPEDFLHNLKIDHEIFDYIAYDWESEREPANEEVQKEGSREEAGSAAQHPFILPKQD